MPSLSALVDGQYQSFPSIQAKIDALESQWRKWVATNPERPYAHFAYMQIMGIGPAALPFLIDRMRGGSTDWLHAIEAITGRSMGTKDMQRRMWIEWFDQEHSASLPPSAEKSPTDRTPDAAQ